MKKNVICDFMLNLIVLNVVNDYKNKFICLIIKCSFYLKIYVCHTVNVIINKQLHA